MRMRLGREREPRVTGVKREGVDMMVEEGLVVWKD